MKLHSGAADLLAQKAKTRGIPVTVTFQVTDRCNYDCVHCYQEHVDKDELSFDEVCRILTELCKLGVLFLTLMGGEFFMRRDADDILAFAHKLGFVIKLQSTGHHISDKRADFLATIRPLQVDISIYGGHAKGHEEVTRHPGSFDRSIAAAQRLIARRIPVLLKSPLMESNAGGASELIKLAASIGAKHSIDTKVTAKEDGDLQPIGLRAKASTLAAFYADEASGSPQYLERIYKETDLASLRPLYEAPCRAGRESAAINPRGEVWPCNSLPLAVGNLRESTFHDIWFGSSKLEDVRELTWASLSECRTCELRGFCQRCHGMALVEHNEMRGPSLEACRHAVAVRDQLKSQGLIPQSHTALPPTWNRVDADGAHAPSLAESTRSGRRSSSLRVLGD